jgi:hypothetical protein
MGVHANVSRDKFPRQGTFLGKEVKVCFNYETRNTVKGECVRDDVEEPFVTIFRLEDGRHVLSTECQYSDA